ncbi:hypothetical protein LENED_012043 [Lentinula edodes]|uniref:Protein kinase domain-containing protein n=1 Tax=Lentinula edodes TaxID=5353 RepID=A0A1Q3ERV0_LENED|nr:hypothetical protein LENED_012043 [Lentinula edodes]
MRGGCVGIANVWMPAERPTHKWSLFFLCDLADSGFLIVVYLQGLQYMHHNNVAHRDCSINNMVMDAGTMYSDQYHPVDLSMKYDWSGEACYES